MIKPEYDRLDFSKSKSVNGLDNRSKYNHQAILWFTYITGGY